MCATRPTGSYVTRSSVAPSRPTDCGAITRSACSTFQAMRSSTALTSARAWRMGLPISDVVSAAHSSASVSSMTRNARSVAARASNDFACHPRCARRARSTFCVISPSSVTATLRTIAPFAGFRTSIERASGSGASSETASTGCSVMGADTTTGVGVATGAGTSAPATSSVSHRASFCPGRRSRWRTNPRSVNRCRVSSRSSSERNECHRSVRCFSSPGVCAPRSSSTPRTAKSGTCSCHASSTTCRCFTTRCPVARTRRDRFFSRKLSSARSTVASSYFTTGSRFVV